MMGVCVCAAAVINLVRSCKTFLTDTIETKNHGSQRIRAVLRNASRHHLKSREASTNKVTGGMLLAPWRCGQCDGSLASDHLALRCGSRSLAASFAGSNRPRRRRVNVAGGTTPG